MTTYAYRITLNDSESIMLEAALKLMIEHCQKKLDEGASAPYWAHRESAKDVLSRLNDDVKQTSGNNFFKRKE